MGEIQSSVLRKKRKNMKIYEHEYPLPYTWCHTNIIIFKVCYEVEKFGK